MLCHEFRERANIRVPLHEHSSRIMDVSVLQGRFIVVHPLSTIL